MPVTASILRAGDQIDVEITPDPPLVSTAREIAGRIRRHPLFRQVGGARFDSIERDLIDSVRSSESREAAYEAMNATIDGFGLSHTAIITPWVSENLFGRGDHHHLGLFVQRIESGGKSRFFIRSMMFGSPAREAGLKIGDELVSVNGIGFGDSPRRTLAGYEARRNISTIQIDRGERVSIEVRRKHNGNLKRYDLAADRALDGVSSTRASVRKIARGEQETVGYIQFWNVMSKDCVTVLRSALADEFADADALAIDLRGRGGQVAVIAQLSKILAAEERPVALLIDREARSAKEMLAHRLRGLSHVTLVGETTAGAVLPASFIPLPDNAQLMLPIGSGDAVIRSFTGGQRLEGRGVTPDIAVKSPLPYQAGRDPILKRSIRLLRRQASGRLLKL